MDFDDYRAVAAWVDRLTERPAVAAELDVVASLAGERASPVVTAEWVVEHGAEEDVLLADVRGPNAHARGPSAGLHPARGRRARPVHGAGSRRSLPARKGRPAAPVTESRGRRAARALRRGSCVAAASALQAIELAGHPRVAVLAGGLRGGREMVEGAVVLESPGRSSSPGSARSRRWTSCAGAWTIPRSRSSTSFHRAKVAGKKGRGASQASKEADRSANPDRAPARRVERSLSTEFGTTMIGTAAGSHFRASSATLAETAIAIAHRRARSVSNREETGRAPT